MKVISTSDASDIFDARTIYTVEISDNAFVDVMQMLGKAASNKQCDQARSDLLYVMQSEDGSHVFNAEGHPLPLDIDETSIIAFTKKYIEQSTC